MNGDQEIEAPAHARPISDLTDLARRRRHAAGPGRQRRRRSRRPRAAPDSTNPEAEDFQKYADCLDKARPEDTDALQRCAELLQQP